MYSILNSIGRIENLEYPWHQHSPVPASWQLTEITQSYRSGTSQLLISSGLPEGHHHHLKNRGRAWIKAKDGWIWASENLCINSKKIHVAAISSRTLVNMCTTNQPDMIWNDLLDCYSFVLYQRWIIWKPPDIIDHLSALFRSARVAEFDIL